jgi:hypothetical protein
MPWSESNGEVLGWIGGSRQLKQARSIYHILGASIFIFVYVCATARKGRRAFGLALPRLLQMEKRLVRSVNTVSLIAAVQMCKQSQALHLSLGSPATYP